jgi:hypothetical protein
MGILALKALHQESAQIENKLSSMQQPDGSWEGNIFYSAMSLLAISPGMENLT